MQQLIDPNMCTHAPNSLIRIPALCPWYFTTCILSFQSVLRLVRLFPTEYLLLGTFYCCYKINGIEVDDAAGVV